MKRRRRRRKPASKHISISATDADWEVVRSHANRRGLSIARYLVELVERDGSEEDTGLRHECPGVALSSEEQREQLESVREIRALMLEGEDAGLGHECLRHECLRHECLRHECLRHECPRHECLGHECLVRDMQERIAVMFAAWTSAMAASGRSEELHAALIRVLGKERARIAATSIAASVATSVVAPAGDSTATSTAVLTDASAAKQVETQADEGKTDPRRDRLL